jgi:2-C-methyl-D-erythritol 2,4-cyclodiphosphate synthase
MRVGTGYDAHRFAENRPLILAGVEVPYNRGLAGHSDADVITHAIIDALLGAASLGSIGKFFPDSESKYKNANSISLLKKTKELLNKEGLEIINIDSTVILEEPRLDIYWDQMRENLSAALNIKPTSVSVKAKTTEGMGFTGRKEGVEAMAIALIR